MTNKKSGNSRALLWVAWLAFGFGVAWLVTKAEGRTRAMAAALDAEDVVSLCGRNSYSLADFWERARADGISAVVLRTKPLASLIGRGDILYFGRDEVAKWKAVGLIAPNASLKADTLWVKDPALAASLVDSTARRGILIATATTGGYEVLQLSEVPPPALAAGYDPALAASLAGHGLTLVGIDSTGRAIENTGATSALLAGVSFRSLRVDAPEAQWFEATYSLPRRVLILRLSAEDGIEGNFAAMRANLKNLAQRGILSSDLSSLALPQFSSWYLFLRLSAFWLLGLLGPLLAARAGLLALRKGRIVCARHCPQAAPVLQIAVGTFAAMGAAAVAGLVACVAYGFWQGLAASTWALWTIAGPLVMAVLSLYGAALSQWRKILDIELTLGKCLKAIALIFGFVVILEPRIIFGWLETRFALAPFEISWPAMVWWLPWRWREILGFACLTHGLFLVDRRLNCPECESKKREPLADSRFWLILGLLGPAGIVATWGRIGAPVEIVLGQTLVAWILGASLGGLSIIYRLARTAAQPPLADMLASQEQEEQEIG